MSAFPESAEMAVNGRCALYNLVLAVEVDRDALRSRFEDGASERPATGAGGEWTSSPPTSPPPPPPGSGHTLHPRTWTSATQLAQFVVEPRPPFRPADGATVVQTTAPSQTRDLVDSTGGARRSPRASADADADAVALDFGDHDTRSAGPTAEPVRSCVRRIPLPMWLLVGVCATIVVLIALVVIGFVES